MFNENFKKQQPFATSFFESLLKDKNNPKIANAYLLTGSDTLAQYYMAMQFSKIINCEQTIFSDNCSCINCSWIRQNRHPAVITISPIDFTYNASGERDKSSSVIKVNQTSFLKTKLLSSSPYHRVIIFTDAAEGKEYERKASFYWKDYKNVLTPPPLEQDSERDFWIPLPLSYKTFKPEAINSLLKTVEEPVSRVTFFFLVKDKEDIIETIVSRSQIIPVLSKNIESMDLSVIQELVNFLPLKNINEAIYLSEKLLFISSQNNINLEDLFDILQDYFRNTLLRSHAHDKVSTTKIIEFIKKIEDSKNELKSYINTQAVIDSLFVSFIE